MTTATMNPTATTHPASEPVEPTLVASAATELVAVATATTPPDDGTPPNLGAIAISTCALMTLFMFSWVTLAMYLAVGNIVDALGVGAFCAVWGGPGFGAVATGVRWARHAEQVTH